MRGRRALSLGLWAAAALLDGVHAAAQGPPDTDVWLAPLSRVGDALVVGAPRNVTRRVGYDNQPSFTLDSRAILYTAVVDGQADVFRYDLARGATTRLTRTPESEYSPTVTPDGRYFSVVRVERDSTQRLWKFPLGGGEPSLVLPGVKPVGYHAWVDDSTIALYVLGKRATLQLADVRTGQVRILAHDVGRALQRVPRRRAFTYVQHDSGFAPTIRQVELPLDPGVEPPGRALAPVWPTQEFHVWHPDGVLLWAAGARLVRWNERSAPGGDEMSWLPVAGLWPDLVRNVSRLAVSPDGRWLAFVAEPLAPPVTKER